MRNADWKISSRFMLRQASCFDRLHASTGSAVRKVRKNKKAEAIVSGFCLLFWQVFFFNVLELSLYCVRFFFLYSFKDFIFFIDGDAHIVDYDDYH